MFLYNPAKLEVLSGPALCPYEVAPEGGWRRPPVAAVFHLTPAAALMAAAESQHRPPLGQILVCGVHLKSGGGEQTLREVRYLGSAGFQDWLRRLTLQASAAAAAKLKGQSGRRSEGGSKDQAELPSPPGCCSETSCQLLIGDFNLASPASGEEGGKRAAWQEPGAKHTQPGDAWAGLAQAGFRLLLPEDAMTNIGPPITQRNFQYDNAVVAFFPDGCRCVAGGRRSVDGEGCCCGAAAAVAAAAADVAGACAFTCSGAAAEELEDIRRCQELLECRPLRTGMVDVAVNEFQRNLKKHFFQAWSDHRPICAWL